MTTIYGRIVPAWLIIDKTRTKEKNDDGVDRQEVVIHHKSSSDTYRLQTKEERDQEDD